MHQSLVQVDGMHQVLQLEQVADKGQGEAEDEG